MEYILALDQGGTKTIALVADINGRICGIGKGPGSCHTFDGMDIAMRAVSTACEQALLQAGVERSEIHRVKAGMTGADWPFETTLLERGLMDTLTIQQTSVVNDCLIARRAGTDAKYGAILCVGTGLNAAVISASGEEFVYGYYIADEDGGAEALARQGLRAVFDAEVRLSSDTQLRQALLARYQFSTVDELVFAYVNRKLGNVKDITPLLFAVANQGDPVARDVIVRFGKRVSRYVVEGLRRYGMENEAVDVVISGSVCSPDNQLLERVLRDTIASTTPRARVINANYEPVVGALLMALDDAHGAQFPMSSPLLKQSAQTFGLIR